MGWNKKRTNRDESESKENPQMFRNWKRKFLELLVHWELLALRFSSSKFRYQPLPQSLAAFGPRLAPARDCEDRLGIIRNYLPMTRGNILDIGSNTGYYLLEFAKLAYLCQGIEPDPELVHFTSLAVYLTNSRGVSCECGRLDLALIERLPK